jgi:hypothetical protein
MSLEGADFAMPQPINKIVPDAHVYLSYDVLQDKPELALLVCKIFAIWARIEQQLTVLLVRVLGADYEPAFAIYSTLTAQHLQNRALDAAAKATLSEDDYLIFSAAISVSESAQAPRNHLAHWSWGGCKQRPDLLVLADPKMISSRDIRIADRIHLPPPFTYGIGPLEIVNLIQFDNSRTLAYSKGDLGRAIRDLEEANTIIKTLVDYIDPAVTEQLYSHLPEFSQPRDQIRAEALQNLNEQRLFREALDRLRGGQRSNPPQPRGSNPQGPVE